MVPDFGTGRSPVKIDSFVGGILGHRPRIILHGTIVILEIEPDQSPIVVGRTVLVVDLDQTIKVLKGLCQVFFVIKFFFARCHIGQTQVTATPVVVGQLSFRVLVQDIGKQSLVIFPNVHPSKGQQSHDGQGKNGHPVPHQPIALGRTIPVILPNSP